VIRRVLLLLLLLLLLVSSPLKLVPPEFASLSVPLGSAMSSVAVVLRNCVADARAGELVCAAASTSSA
jgi:hypothetical protein